MKAYRELAVDVGHSDLQELKYPELRHYEPGGKEASLAGKMRTRSKYSHHNKRSPKGMNLPQTDYLAAKKLREAASGGSFEEVAALLRGGANAQKSDSKGRTALHFASCRGEPEMVDLLVSHGASVNKKDCNGSTPLHLACCTNHIQVVTLLLRAGTDVNTVDDRGITPLHLAHSRLRMARKSDDEGGEGLSRKKEMCAIVEMLKRYLELSRSHAEEARELEALASKLSLSDTPREVDEVQALLEDFTSLSIQKRCQQPQQQQQKQQQQQQKQQQQQRQQSVLTPAATRLATHELQLATHEAIPPTNSPESKTP